MKANGAVVGWSFGKPHSAIGNFSASRICLEESYFHFPIVADRSIHFDESIDVIRIGSSDEARHESTWKLAKETALLAKINRWKFVRLVSCPEYLPRCKRDLEKAFKKYNVSCEIELVIREDFPWYDANCSQDWIASKEAFLEREKRLMALPFWAYALISNVMDSFLA